MSGSEPSFQDIVAGVKRMREQYETPAPPEAAPAPAAPAPAPVATTEHSPAPLARPPVPLARAAPPAAPAAPPASSRPITTFPPNVPTPPIPRSRSPTPAHRGTPPPVQSHSAIQVSNTQKGNPLLTESQMKTTPWSYNGSILSDYYINPRLQILFLSLKYYKLHPEYLWQRLKKINKGASMAATRDDHVLRILLVVVDVDLHHEILRKLADFCLKHDLLLVLAWSFEEAGNYVCLAKQHELLAADQTLVIKGTHSDDYHSAMQRTLTSVKPLNKTDVVNLLANFKSFERIVTESTAPSGALDRIHGLGKRKRDTMRKIFSEPFIYNRQYD
jgi:DNA excision repair protein ERCC-1